MAHHRELKGVKQTKKLCRRNNSNNISVGHTEETNLFRMLLNLQIFGMCILRKICRLFINYLKKNQCLNTEISKY